MLNGIFAGYFFEAICQFNGYETNKNEKEALTKLISHFNSGDSFWIFYHVLIYLMEILDFKEVLHLSKNYI
jgi:hypothetical protein